MTRLQRKTRRGAVLAMVIVMLSLLQLTVISSVKGTTDDTDEAVLRVQTLRAFYASESGALIALAEDLRGNTPPGTGDTLALPNATATFLETPWDDGNNILEVEGQADAAHRRIQVGLE